LEIIGSKRLTLDGHRSKRREEIQAQRWLENRQIPRRDAVQPLSEYPRIPRITRDRAFYQLRQQGFSAEMQAPYGSQQLPLKPVVSKP
jgi:hypothetical protein